MNSHHHHRRTLPSLPRTLLTTASLAFTCAHSLVLPTSLISLPATGTLGTAQHTGSSVRKSINFGPSIQAASHHAHDPSPALSVWNANHFAALHAIGDKCDALVDEGTRAVARCVGQQLAASFVEQLHPDAEFRLVDTVLSHHSGVVHAHFVQQIDGVPVANANLNVNVDLATGKVLSYGDSSFVGSVKALEDSAAGAYSRSRRASAWKQRVQSWAADAVESIEHAAGQVVFGSPSSSSSDNGPQGARAGARASAADPRQGLLTFLGIQSNNVQLSTALESAPRAQLVDEMTVAEASLDDKHDFEIALDVVDLDEPVKATLTYVHDGADLKLAWKYEVKSSDNMYEAYLTADGSVAPGDEVPLLVVDWVRDFAPTGGELGIDSRASDVPLRDLAARPASAVTSAPVASTTDKKEVAAMRKVKPAYKVFPWGVNAPDEGKRAVLRGTLVELDDEASPAGWHTVPGEKRPFGDGMTPDTFYYETRGNNVMAQDNPSGGNSASGFRANGGKDMSFKFGIHMPKEGHPLEPTSYIEASTTELFYTNNEIHDLYHRYGFDEEAGNFQDAKCVPLSLLCLSFSQPRSAAADPRPRPPRPSPFVLPPCSLAAPSSSPPRSFSSLRCAASAAAATAAMRSRPTRRTARATCVPSPLPLPSSLPPAPVLTLSLFGKRRTTPTSPRRPTVSDRACACTVRRARSLCRPGPSRADSSLSQSGTGSSRTATATSRPASSSTSTRTACRPGSRAARPTAAASAGARPAAWARAGATSSRP